MKDVLLTQADIARHLGISRQAVSMLVKRREVNGFPLPAIDSAQGLRRWSLGDVEAWRETRQRLVASSS